MAADFNAGSIEGTLGLDTTPFAAGLTKAKMQADEFAGKKVEPKVGLDDAPLKTTKDKVTVDLDRLGHKKVTPKADLDISEALAKYAILNKVLDAGGLGKSTIGPGLMAGKITAMIGGLLGLAAAAGPAGAALIGFGGAAATAFAGVGLSFALFGKAVGSAMTEITKANKAGVTLTGVAGQAQSALKGLTTEWQKLINSAHSQVFQVLTDAFHGIAGILPKLAPLLRITATGVDGIVKSVFALTRQPIFEHFLHTLESFMHGFLSGAGPVLTNLLHTFMNLFIQLQPLMAMLGHGIVSLSSAAEHFTGGSGLTHFVGYVVSVTPMLLHLLGSLVHTLMNLGKGIAPLAGPAVHFLAALVGAIGKIHLAPLAKGFGDLFTAIRPLLGVAVQLINTVLGPLGHLLSSLAKGPVHALTNSLSHNLQPAFHALHGILHDLVKPLSEFAGSIANLANPTGVHLISTALVSLRGVVHTLAPAFGKLMVALENVIDNGLETIIPLIPPLAKGLGKVASALVPVVNGLAGILSHRAVADLILGIAGAIFLGVKAFEAYKAVMALSMAIQDAYAASTYGFAVAQDAGKLSTVMFIASLVAQKVAMAASAVASGVMTAAQWALNTAMDANPITLVVIAIAALAAGLIYAYQHSKTFRTIVQGALHGVEAAVSSVVNFFRTAIPNVINFVAQHWKLIASILTGPIGAAVIFLISHWNQIKSGFSNLMSDVGHIVSQGIQAVVGWFRDLPGQIMQFGANLFNAGQTIMGKVFDGIKNAASAVGGFVAGFATNIANAVRGTINNLLGLPRSISINTHIPGLGTVGFTIPALAKGGVTNGPTTALVGDNPGGKEAVIPLDKYDLPKKGESAAHAAQTHADNARIIGLLSAMAQHLAALANGSDDYAGLEAALAGAYTTASEKSMKKMVEEMRKTRR